MDVRAVFEVSTAILTSLGGGGLIVYKLSGYLGKMWADRALAKQKQEYAFLNIAFTSQLDLATRRIQVELDALGHLHKLRTQAEFEKLQELWKSVAMLRSALNQLADDELELFGALEDSLLKIYNGKRSREFLERYAGVRTLLDQETLAIPIDVADAVNALLQSAACRQEKLGAEVDPEMTLQSVSPYRDRVLQRRKNHALQLESDAKKLELLMRKFLSGGAKPGPEPSENPSKTL